MTFIDESRGLASNFDYEYLLETVTPPLSRSTDATSAFSTPTPLAHPIGEPELLQTPNLPPSRVTSHGIDSPSTKPPLASPLHHRLWEEHTVSDTSELSQEALPPNYSSNPLTIEGILNKSAANISHQGIHQSYNRSVESPSISPIYLERPVWPLADPAEALLLRHFVQNLATWVGS